MNNTTTAPETRQPSDLRAEADRLEAEAASMEKGKVFISPYDGASWIHDGTPIFSTMARGMREASEAEVQTLRAIPEFASRLDRVRGGK